MKMKLSIAVISGVLLSSGAWAGPGDNVSFPENYKETYTLYHSHNRAQNADQYIRIYVNDVGLSGTQENGQLPYGSKLVAEVYMVKKDAKDKVVTNQLGQRLPTKLAVLAVMERREGAAKEYPAGMGNDDWDFAAFKTTGERANKDLTECAACHAPLKEDKHLFSYESIIAEQSLK